MDYAVLRKRMVEEQLIARGIKDQKVIDVFMKIERHKFVPEELHPTAYADFPISIGENQTISQPYIVALMTESLALSGREKVLEIGTGSGYQTALLAELAKEVYSIERFTSLAKRAEGLLIDELGYKNIRIKCGDGTLGWPEALPFDRMIITAACPNIPLPLIDQLADNGRLILPQGETFSQVLSLFTKVDHKFTSTKICDCVFVPLVGKYGFHSPA